MTTTVPVEGPSEVPVSGRAEPPFEPLRDALARVAGDQETGGAALAIYREGRCVVDLVAGDLAPDALHLLFSVTKVPSAIAAAMAHERGLLDLDAPLADRWPVFGRPSTSSITTRMVLSHRSGIASLDRTMTLDDLVAGRDIDAVERQEPYWVPDTAHGYHGHTYGALLDGVFQRTVGRSVGAFVADELAGPLGLDLWIGLPREVLGRVARVTVRPQRVTAPRARFLRGSGIPASATTQLATTLDLYNDPAYLGASLPATSGVGSAHALARLMAATLGPVDGTRPLTGASVDAMVATRSEGLDRVLGVVTAFGSGVQRPFPQLPLFGLASYGHEAAGGSGVVADADLGIAVGFTTSVHPALAGASPGFLALLPTIRHCLRA